jgi:hypothetical protein
VWRAVRQKSNGLPGTRIKIALEVTAAVRRAAAASAIWHGNEEATVGEEGKTFTPTTGLCAPSQKSGCDKRPNMRQKGKNNKARMPARQEARRSVFACRFRGKIIARGACAVQPRHRTTPPLRAAAARSLATFFPARCHRASDDDHGRNVPRNGDFPPAFFWRA